MNDTSTPLTGKVEGYYDGALLLLPKLGVAAVVLLLVLLAAWGVRFAVDSAFRRRGRGDLGALLGGAAKWALILFGVLVVATIVFPSIKPSDLLASLGVGSVAIGFAFKDILQNWVSGLLILYRQPFRQGDQIVSGSFEGTVEAIQARATMIRTYDGQRIVIPNSDIYTGVVTVRTAFEHRRSQYDVGIGYGDDVQAACRIIADTLRATEGVVREPAPDAIPWELAGSSVNIRARWWTASARTNVVLVRGRAIIGIKHALSEAGIDLPFPTRVVLLHDQTEEADGDRSRQREGWPVGRTEAPPR